MFLNRGPWCILILILLLSARSQAQFLKGRILDNISQKPIAKAVVYEWGTGHSGITNDAGFFELQFPSDRETMDLQITAEAYETFSIHLHVRDWNPDTQEFFLFPANSILELAVETNQAVSDDEAGEDEVFSLLHSARDPVKDAASFQFGSFRYRMRGVPGIYDQLGFNGFLLNDPVTGFLPFYLFSGQSLLTKYGDDYLWYKDHSADFGASGLAQWITSKPSSFRKELSLRYASANRSYDNRLDLFYSSGPLGKGWGVIAGANRRWAQEAFSPGSYYDAWGGFAGLSKELGSKHQLQLTAVYAPVIRGKASPATLEVYELAGDPYYNSYWGYQQGEKRNSRWSDRSVPMLTLNYDGRLNDHLSWSAGCLGLSGKFADGQLDWYNAPDPRPDYYQKLPSYIQDSAVADAVRLSWKVNPNVRQINWDRMYQVNYNNQDTIRNANGIPNQTVTGRRAAYWLSERHADPSEIEHFASLKYNKGRHDLMLGYRGEWSKTAHYLKVYDLLGADFMVDLEDFATLPEQQHPDIRQKNHVVGKDGNYAYDYSAHNQNYSVHGNYSYAARKWDAAFGAQVQRRSFYRKSDLENAIFSNSYGKSETIVETGLGLKTLLTWKFNGRNYVQANVAYQLLPNRFDQTFINPQWRGDVLEHNDRTKVYGGDIAYYYRDPGLKIQFTAFWLRYEDQILNKNFYLDDQLESASNAELSDGSLISAFFTGLDQQHLGIEAAVEWNIGWGFECSGVYMLGDFRYTSRPEFLIYDKFSSSVSKHTIYLKNFFVPGTAQQAATLSLTYNFRKNGFAVLSFANMLDDQYLEPNPLRRISEAVRDVDPASTQFRGIIDQQKLPSAFFVNAFVYKSFRVFKQNLSMSLSVNNLLNKKDILSGGFEQYRFDYETRDPSKFPPKYYYLQGINYYLGINWRYDFSK